MIESQINTTMKKLIYFFSLYKKNKQHSLRIHIASAGKLTNLLTDSQKKRITHLTLTGKIDARDFKSNWLSA